MTTRAMRIKLAQVDRVLKFFAQCPGTKRGRPMDPGAAIHAEKANPGSVCMKVSRARDGRGQRHIFYKVTSRAEKAAQKNEQKRTPEPPKEVAKKTSGAQKPTEETPGFHSGVTSKSAKQQKWAKIFHHALERNLRGYINSLPETDSPVRMYAKEAWGNLSKLEHAGTIFGLKQASPEVLFWSMLSPNSIKELASKTGKDLTTEEHGPLFMRIMKSKLKDDPSFEEAITTGKAWPVAEMKEVAPKRAIASTSQPPEAKRAAATEAKPSSRLAKIKAKIKEKVAAANDKATKIKAKSDEWQKEHPVLSTLAKSAAKIGIGSIMPGLLQEQAPIVRFHMYEKTSNEKR